MKILVVFTGGTIGSSVKNGIADIDGNPAKKLLELYPDIDFVCIEPFSILSENSTVDTLEHLCNFMLGVDYDNYSGVILTHGSDTLGYTAAALGIALSYVRIPVMLTAADYVLSDERSNGTENFCGCVDFIGEFVKGKHEYSGVYAVWKNRGDFVRVHHARCLEQADFNDEFHSYRKGSFGTMSHGSFVKDKAAYGGVKLSLFSEDLQGKLIRLSRNVLLLKSYVGADFDCISLDGKDAVLVQAYHSGTVCTEGENTSFVKFAKRCKEQGVDVFLYSVKDRSYIYRSAKKIPWGAVTPVFDTGECSAYVGLLFRYGKIE